MKKYDWGKIQTIIKKNKETIIKVECGLQEDWFWTADTIYEEGKYSITLAKGELEVSGATGSQWATPVMCIYFKDGTEKWIDVYNGESDKTFTHRPPLSYLSKPAQEEANKRYEKNICS